MLENKLAVEYRPLAGLIPYCNNARTHSEAQVAQIAASMVEFGFTNPVLVDGNNGVVAGHGRVLAARKLGLYEVPVIELAHLSPTQKRAYILADNRLALSAGWDEEILALELATLQDDAFDLSLTGFDPDELAELLAAEESEGLSEDDAVPETQEVAISQLGDIWLLGEHRLLCGDATDEDDFTALMAGDLADMSFVDPPYNVNYATTPKDRLRGSYRPILNDNLGGEFAGFLTAACTHILQYTKGAIYIAMSSSELDTLQAAFRAAGGKWSTFIIWAKNHFTLGRADYQRQYEPILYGWKEGIDHFWCGDRNQGDVWQINKPNKNDLHPCLCTGTEVLTENGWRIIESLVAGDCVLTADGVFRSVELVSSHFIEKCIFRIAVSGVERAVDATHNHPFLVLRDGELAWVEASQIIVGDEICSPTKATFESNTENISEWNMTSSGNETAGQSQTDTASITLMATSKTIKFQTYNLSPTLSTSGFTPVVSSTMAFGGSLATLADRLNLYPQNTGISARMGFPMDGDAVRVISEKWYNFVLRSVSAVEKINYSGLVWNLSVKDSPTFETRIGMSHNTMKPVELVERAIRNSSRSRQIVLDCFAGSGTTLIACEKLGRYARLMELDPKYCDVIICRWQNWTGKQASRQSDGLLFADLQNKQSLISSTNS